MRSVHIAAINNGCKLVRIIGIHESVTMVSDGPGERRRKEIRRAGNFPNHVCELWLSFQVSPPSRAFPVTTEV